MRGVAHFRRLRRSVRHPVQLMCGRGRAGHFHGRRAPAGAAGAARRAGPLLRAPVAMHRRLLDDSSPSRSLLGCVPPDWGEFAPAKIEERRPTRDVKFLGQG